MVHGSDGVVVILLVAGDARSLRNVVVVVNVAIHASARWHGVLAGEREARLRVIEGCGLPAIRRVAGLAGLRETALHVGRVRGVLEIFQVA